jgi:predicted transcriptional regulator
MNQMSVTKEHLHELIEELPDSEIEEAARYLKRLRELADDPVYQAFMDAPYDDESLTPEEEAAIAEGEEDWRCGRLLTVEEVRARLGSRTQ